MRAQIPRRALWLVALAGAMAETSLVMQGFDGESIAEKEDVFVFGGGGALDYERVDGAAKFSYAVVQTAVSYTHLTLPTIYSV